MHAKVCPLALNHLWRQRQGLPVSTLQPRGYPDTTFLISDVVSQVFLHESAGSCKTTFSVMFLVIVCDEKYVALQRESALSSGISPSVSAHSRTCPSPAGVGQYKTNSMVFLWAFCFICCCFGISVLLLESKKVGRSWEGGNMKSMV